MHRILQRVLGFLLSQRQSGTTTFIQKIAKENDVYVIVRQAEEKTYFDKSCRKNVYSLGELAPEKIDGWDKKPILIDNGAFHYLVQEALLKIGSQEEIITHQKHVLSTIGKVLALGNKMNPHLNDKIQVNNRQETQFP